MKAGTFNMDEYLQKLNEETEIKAPDEAIIIPKENRKFYDWLKKEYQKGQQEAKVEISHHEFKPGYELGGNPGNINKDFKPGVYSNTDSDVSAPKDTNESGEDKKSSKKGKVKVKVKKDKNKDKEE
jgi:hypothetical protein